MKIVIDTEKNTIKMNGKIEQHQLHAIRSRLYYNQVDYSFGYKLKRAIKRLINGKPKKAVRKPLEIEIGRVGAGK